MSIDSVMLSNHLILCHPLLLLPSIFPSIRVFSNELALHIRWPKYWSFSFSISLSNEYSGLDSFRTDWFDITYAFLTLSVSPCAWVVEVLSTIPNSVCSVFTSLAWNWPWQKYLHPRNHWKLQMRAWLIGLLIVKNLESRKWWKKMLAVQIKL